MDFAATFFLTSEQTVRETVSAGWNEAHGVKKSKHRIRAFKNLVCFHSTGYYWLVHGDPCVASLYSQYD